MVCAVPGRGEEDAAHSGAVGRDQGGGLIVAVCIVGGLVTECEREDMGEIIRDTEADAETLHGMAGLRIEREDMRFADFEERYGAR